MRFPTLAGGSVSHSHPCVMFRMAHSNPFRGSTHPRYFPVTFILSSIQLKTPTVSLSAQCSPFWHLACELQPLCSPWIYRFCILSITIGVCLDFHFLGLQPGNPVPSGSGGNHRTHLFCLAFLRDHCPFLPILKD